MKVQQVSFNKDNRSEQKQVSGRIAFSSSFDKFETSNKKDVKKYILVGGGLTVAIIALLKRKQIGDFFSKLFKNSEKVAESLEVTTTAPKSKSPIGIDPPIVQSKPRYELPKPEFKFDETNPVEFADERNAYIDKLVNYASKDEDIATEALELFSKYGSREKLQELVGSITVKEPETDKLANAYLKTYHKIAKFREANDHLRERPDSTCLRFLFDNFRHVMSQDTKKLMIEEFKRTGCSYADTVCLSNFTERDSLIKHSSEKDFEEIKILAQDAIDTIKQRGYTWK